MPGETLANLDLRRKYQIQVFAIRREGHFSQFPHGDMAKKSGDLLLLCGRLADSQENSAFTIVPVSISTENPLLMVKSVSQSLKHESFEASQTQNPVEEEICAPSVHTPIEIRV